MLRTRLAALSVLVLATACHGGQGTGPLGATPPSSYLCTVAGAAGQTTVGYIALTNHSKDALTVQGLELVHATGLRLLGGSLVPILGNQLVGTDASYPPSWAAAHPAAWAERVPASDGPMPAGSTKDLLVGLEPTATTLGKADEVEVRYLQGHHRYVWHSALTIAVAKHGQMCHA